MRASDIKPIAPGREQNFAPSAQQSQVLQEIVDWVKGKRHGQHWFLSGYGGTGKTELSVGLAQYLPDLDIQYAACTGKAAAVQRQRGATNAATLHSLLYGPPLIEQDRAGNEQLFWQRRDAVDADLIIADECSMIGQKLGRDLLATGVKVLVTGDPMQLPPVSDSAFFTNPNSVLTEIHRQAAGSGPLMRATAIRNGGVLSTRPFDLDRMLQADIAICAMNRTRRQINKLIRRERGFADPLPEIGDRIVCLKNNRENGVWNGTLWSVEAVEHCRKKATLQMRIVDDIGNKADVVAHEDGFFFGKLDQRDRMYDDLDLFDFGYALTAHKAQGSEWANVVIIDELETPGFAWTKPDDLSPTEYAQRWMYTAVTRAKHLVALMGAPRA